MATFLGKGKLFIGSANGEFKEIGAIKAEPEDELFGDWGDFGGEIRISGTIVMTPRERRSFLVWWIMFSALATANRILR